MSTATRSPVAPTPNVTPMIDVMLVLLCIFMVVTPALMHGTVAVPPEAEHATPRPEADDHTLAIDPSGAYQLDRRPIARGELGARLRVLFGDHASERVLYLRAHHALPFATVDSALGVARASGIRVVGLVTEVRRR